MEPKEEQAYIQGSRTAWLLMLQQCLMRLNYEGNEAENAAWILEREHAVRQLREVCAVHGDNDWEDSLDLGDVIEKHLTRHLEM